MGRPEGNDRGEAYWRNGREHASGYQNNEDARANWEQGYREEKVDENVDERSWSPYATHAPPARPAEQTGEGSGMQRGSWRGQGWGAEVYRGGVGTGNYQSPYMRVRHPDYGDPSMTRGGYGGQPRGIPQPPEQSMRGPHAGKGPMGYKRSDERIREDVCEQLTEHHEVDASEIEVSVENGEVTLIGMANARRDKLMAEHIAEGVSGVIDIHNQIRVRREGNEQVRSAPPAPKRDTTKS